ncbi:lysophospholipid acyltransferase family protein, partial [bacterium]
LCTAHLGNWHIMGQRLVDQGFPINNIVKKQRNPFVFNTEVKGMEKVGMKVTILQKTPKNILRAIKSGDIVEFLIDQDAGPDGIFIDFFGEQASTAQGPALFGSKMNAPIIFALDVRRKNNKHTVYLENVEYNTSLITEQSIKSIMQYLTKRLQDYIIKYPEQYFWLHKRWLTKKK